MRIKHTFRLPPALSAQLADYAGRKRISQALVVEAYPYGVNRLAWRV